MELLFHRFNILTDEHGTPKIKEGCKYIDDTDCCFIRIIRFRPFNAGSYHPPPSEMPATQSILYIGGFYETALVITEKKSVTFMNEFLLQYVALTSIPAKRFLSNGCEPNVTKYALLPRQLSCFFGDGWVGGSKY